MSIGPLPHGRQYIVMSEGENVNITDCRILPTDERDYSRDDLRWLAEHGTPARLARSMPWRIRFRRMWRAFRGQQ